MESKLKRCWGDFPTTPSNDSDSKNDSKNDCDKKKIPPVGGYSEPQLKGHDVTLKIAMAN